MKQKILIIGGMGFIGKHTSDVLVENGFRVYIFDIFKSIKKYKDDFHKDIELISGSVTIISEIKRLFRNRLY